MFVDESGFYLLPALVRTYAPRGNTPIIRELLTRDHLSAVTPLSSGVSAITPEGKLYMMVQEDAFKSPDVVRFLVHLLRHIGGKLLVIWDRSPIHRGQAVKDFLATRRGKRVHMEQLPAYAPELNPDEGIWSHLKGTELRNVACQGIPHLRCELRRAKERLRHKTGIIHACILQTGLL